MPLVISANSSQRFEQCLNVVARSNYLLYSHLMSRCRALLSPSATVLEATQVYSPAEARLTSCVVDIVDIIVDIISIHLQHQGAVAQDDAPLHVLRHPLALQSAFIVCMYMSVGGRASREPSRRFRRVLREGSFEALGVVPTLCLQVTLYTAGLAATSHSRNTSSPSCTLSPARSRQNRIRARGVTRHGVISTAARDTCHAA